MTDRGYNMNDNPVKEITRPCIMVYKGYGVTQICIECDEETGRAILYGKLDGITDLIMFQADSMREIEQSFRNAVDDYLDFCKEVGKEPERPLP